MKSLYLLAIAAVVVISACTDSTSPNRNEGLSSPADDVAAAVRKLGFSTVGMIDRGDVVIVEGDVVLEKAGLLSLAERGVRSVDPTQGLRPNQPRLQWVVDTLVARSNVSNIRVDLSGIASDQNWVNAVRAAISDWNSVPGTVVYFVESSPADLSFVFADLRNPNYPDISVIAQAMFPTGSPGRVGSQIKVNTYAPGLSASQKEFNMVHEMGHTIGFRHTNWQGYNCGANHFTEHAGDGGAHQVAETPPTDASSVMNGCYGDHSWTGFSGYDEIAVSHLYAPGSSLSESNSGGYPLVYAAGDRGPSSLDLKIEYKHTEWYDNLQQYQTTSYTEVVGPVGQGSYTTIDHPYGSAYCSDWADAPYPQEEAYYVLTVTYPQGTSFINSAPAHVLDYSSAPWYQCS
jgi:hypothetical protein